MCRGLTNRTSEGRETYERVEPYCGGVRNWSRAAVRRDTLQLYFGGACPPPARGQASWENRRPLPPLQGRAFRDMRELTPHPADAESPAGRRES